MPSGTPPPRPAGLIRQMPAPADSAATPASGAPAPSGVPSIINPTLRRFWQQPVDPDAPTEARAKRRGLSGGVAWVAIIVMALISAALIRQGPGLLEPPPRVLAPVPHAVLPAPPTAAPDPELVRGFGLGAVNQGGRTAEAAGLAGEQAIICGRRSRAWVNDARDALAKELAGRFPTFEEDPTLARRMRAHLAARFHYGQKLVAPEIAERGQQYVCDNLLYAAEYGMMVRAARQAGVAEQ